MRLYPSCQRLIVLVRETQAVAREAMEAYAYAYAYADGVMIKSCFGSVQGVFIQDLQTLAEGQVYYPEEIRRLEPNVPGRMFRPWWRLYRSQKSQWFQP